METADSLAEPLSPFAWCVVPRFASESASDLLSPAPANIPSLGATVAVSFSEYGTPVYPLGATASERFLDRIVPVLALWATMANLPNNRPLAILALEAALADFSLLVVHALGAAMSGSFGTSVAVVCAFSTTSSLGTLATAFC